jgi:parallel beta-helix repeat protein
MKITGDTWCVWRKPKPEELRAMVMLSLAHGAKGVFFKWFDSYVSDDHNQCPPTLKDCIVTPPDPITETIYPTELYYEIQNNLALRLTSKLGQTLKDLKYNGGFIELIKPPPPPPADDFPTFLDYLALSSNESTCYFHAGLLKRKNTSDDKYFMLLNVDPDYNRFVTFTVANNFGVENLRIKYVENPEILDITIKSQYSSEIPIPPGEGFLFQVAPVIKYGGKLILSEATQDGMILYDDMIIENGAVLEINGSYTCNANITIKNGSIINTADGILQFAAGKKLIIDGPSSISGTSGDKLLLRFSEPVNEEPIGITINAGGSLTMSNCVVEDATIGILSLLNANYLNIENVDFVDCGDASINISGQNGQMSPTPVSQISYCSMENSKDGISVSNLSSIIIHGNTITNTDCGIKLLNVSDAQIIGNTIQSNTEVLQGIFSTSSGGIFRGNIISGHTSGIQLANSSPKIGGNEIYLNKYHGIYIGSGCFPIMNGELAGNPPNMYAISGYNEIYENGGFQEAHGPRDNDGSEIFFYSSKAAIMNGCNSIYDDRPSSPLLVNTLLLMNGYSSGLPIAIKGQNNFWGDTVYAARFGSLNVQYIPYYSDPCILPQGGGIEDQLVIKNQFSQVIDTVYKTGLDAPELSATEFSYAEAEEYYLIGNLTNSLQTYESIIASSATDEEKHFAYERKYTIGRLQNKSPEYFNNLSSVFSNLASNTEDTLAMKRLTQLSTLSKVGEQEYETAIDEFDGIIQQNPNTEEAVYAEIDALTTALLIEENDSTLQKGRLGKYLVKSSSDYHRKVDEILRKNFGSSTKENAKELLPTEYTLYQNYPNPFNPTTTIKYDLPDASDVSLIIYDILGRKVKELLSTKQPAGKYEVQFDASNLASGIYIYQLIAEKFISSKKMILLK